MLLIFFKVSVLKGIINRIVPRLFETSLKIYKKGEKHEGCSKSSPHILKFQILKRSDEIIHP